MGERERERAKEREKERKKERKEKRKKERKNKKEGGIFLYRPKDRSQTRSTFLLNGGKKTWFRGC